MKYFLKELLEPTTYFIYCLILYAAYVEWKSVQYKLLFFYYFFASLLLYSAVVQMEMNILTDWDYNIFFLVTALVFSYYYYGLYRSAFKKKLAAVCCLVNILAFVYFNIIKNGFQLYNSFEYAIVFLSIIVYSLFYYHDVLMNVNEENILLRFDFWLVSANLFYFLGAFIVVVLYDYTPPNLHGDLWTIQSIVLFISSLLALYGYLMVKKK